MKTIYIKNGLLIIKANDPHKSALSWGIDLPQLQSHFPYAVPPSNNSEQYPYIETVHPEDMFSIDMGEKDPLNRNREGTKN